MSISRILKIMGIICAILCIASVVGLYMVNLYIGNERGAVAREAEIRELASELISVTNNKSDVVKEYIQYGYKDKYDNFMNEFNENKTQEKIISQFESLNISEEIMGYLKQAIDISDELTETELEAVKAYEEGKSAIASYMVLGSSYEARKNTMASYLDIFQDKINEEAELYTSEMMVKTDILFRFINIEIIALIIFILSTFIVLGRKISRLADIAKKWKNYLIMKAI